MQLGSLILISDVGNCVSSFKHIRLHQVPKEKDTWTRGKPVAEVERGSLPWAAEWNDLPGSRCVTKLTSAVKHCQALMLALSAYAYSILQQTTPWSQSTCLPHHLSSKPTFTSFTFFTSFRFNPFISFTSSPFSRRRRCLSRCSYICLRCTNAAKCVAPPPHLVTQLQ